MCVCVCVSLIGVSQGWRKLKNICIYRLFDKLSKTTSSSDVLLRPPRYSPFASVHVLAGVARMEPFKIRASDRARVYSVPLHPWIQS